MTGKISSRYALRSLRRYPRRTVLSMLGAGVGCAIALFSASWIRGGAEMQIRAASESGAGHIRVVPAGWTETRDNALRLPGWKEALETVKAFPGVRTAAPRARAKGLLAFGNRSAGVEIVGVRPDEEARSNRIVYKSSLKGRYLEPGDSGKVVIGAQLARRLRVDVDDDLYVTLVGGDEMKSAMLSIAGTLDTGSKDLDTTVCHVTLDDLINITGSDGAGEIAIMLEHHELIEPSREALAAKLGGGRDVITWKEVMPEIAANVEGDTAFTTILVAIIVLVVSLGIAAAQITAVLERRREFAVLAALGMKGRQLVGLIMLEAVAVGLGGAVVALALGGFSAYRLATRGIDLAKLMGEELAFGSVLLDPTIYGDFGPWIVWYALGISLASTVAASIYPAWYATRTDPATALRKV
jgi:ABC-type lipoprotein release transport system permease subunit